MLLEYRTIDTERVGCAPGPWLPLSVGPLDPVAEILQSNPSVTIRRPGGATHEYRIRSGPVTVADAKAEGWRVVKLTVGPHGYVIEDEL